MKSALLSSLAIAALTIAVPATALQINQNAQGVFNAYNGADAQYISNSISTGVYNNNAASTKAIVGGLARNVGANQTVYIFGYNTVAAASVTCYIYGYNYQGTLNDSGSFTVTGVAGYWNRSVALTGLQTYGNIVAYCILPTSGQGRIFSYSVLP